MTFNLKTLPITADKADVEWTNILFGAASQAAAAPEPFALAALRDKLDDYIRRAGTKTVSDPFAIEQTWDGGAGTIFTALRVNATDTSSSSGSRLMALQVNGQDRFVVEKNTRLRLTTGNPGGNTALLLALDNTRIGFGQDAGAQAWGGFSSGAMFLGSSADVLLARDAADTLAQRRGTNAQAFRIYNTFTDAVNYERADLYWTSNIFVVGTAASGTGAQRQLLLSGGSIQLQTSGTNCWNFSGSGHLLANADNSYDIGTSGGNRPGRVFVGTAVYSPYWVIPGAGQVGNGGADGDLVLSNTAGTDFGILKFGGASSSFPALKRSSVELHARRADDSADASFQAAAFKVAGNQVLGAQGAAVSDASGGSTIDAEARTAINVLLARLRTHGLIAA